MIYDYADYKIFINQLIKNKDHSRGEFTRLAQYLGVSNVLISQIFKGNKELTVEQGLKLTQYFGFNELQTKYFITSLNFNRAGNQDLKKYYVQELTLIRLQSQKISERVPSHQVLTEEQKAIYYSSSIYSAVHLACALPFIKDEQDISTHLRLSLAKVDGVVKFLLETGLIKKDYGELNIGKTHIHLNQESPFLSHHHQNWRLLTVNKCHDVQKDELVYTAPMVISKKLAMQIHERLLDFIQTTVRSTDGCPDEELWSLNIDFMRM